MVMLETVRGVDCLGIASIEKNYNRFRIKYTF